MIHDVMYSSISLTLKSTELAALMAAWRVQHSAVVYRVKRENQGGGFGNTADHPYCWAVAVFYDGQLARIVSARGKGREFNSLDKLELWLRSQGIAKWQVHNDLEEVKAISS